MDAALHVTITLVAPIDVIGGAVHCIAFDDTVLTSMQRVPLAVTEHPVANPVPLSQTMLPPTVVTTVGDDK